MLLAASLGAGGCAMFSTPPPTSAPTAPAWAPPPEIVSPAPVRPAAASAPATDNLWQRIAADLSFADVAHARVAEQRAWLARYPRHLPNVTERARPFMPEIVRQIEARGLPVDLALLPALESGYRPQATSPRGAAGLWQFMSGTARQHGLRVDAAVDDRRGFSRATRAALDHLERLNARFGGDWLLAVAAYNCGEHCVSRAQRRARARGTDGGYWDLELPRETMRYVPRWLALLAAFREAGGGLPPLPVAPTLAEIAIDPPVDLPLARELSGLPAGDFDRLNARYHPNAVVPVVESVWLPVDTAETFQARLAALSPEERARRTRYRVQRGDSLWRIARRHAVSVDYLRRINGIGSSSLLKPGQVLKLVEID